MRHTKEIKSLIDVLIKSDRFHLLTVFGPPGWGKTNATLGHLVKIKADFQNLGSYASPLGLFNKLYECREQTVVIDDTAGLLHNPQSLSILNSATWVNSADDKRVVAWTSTVKTAATPEFEFNGKVILLSNFEPETPQARALTSRSLFYRIEMNEDMICEKLLVAAQSRSHFKDSRLSARVARFLVSRSKEFDATRFSLRTLELGMELAKQNPKGWQALLERLLPRRNQRSLVPGKPSDISTVKHLAKSGLSVNNQIEQFKNLTGKGRRSFFYAKEKIQNGAQ